MAWRVEDEVLLERLEDEELVDRLFACMLDLGRDGEALPHVMNPLTSPPAPRPTLLPRLPGRAGGLVGEARKLPPGAAAVAQALAGDIVPLARFVDALPMRGAPPALLHHLAIFHGKAAVVLEARDGRSDEAATAWVRAFAAWLALAEERRYLDALEDSVLGVGASAGASAGSSLRKSAEWHLAPPRVALEWLGSTLGRRATASARELSLPGRAALAALARTDEAARLAGVEDALARSASSEAERQRTAALEAALAVIVDSLEEANVRGNLTVIGGSLLFRAVEIWRWSSHDPMVEVFVVERVEKIGWELYRARRWDELRFLVDPYRHIFDSLARRIMRDPSQIAYASACAQMFVFLAELERTTRTKIEVAERALAVCPTHRNGRLVLASALCEDAMTAMRRMELTARGSTPAGEVTRVEALLARAESLYPQSSTLPEARKMFEQLRPIHPSTSPDKSGSDTRSAR